MVDERTIAVVNDNDFGFSGIDDNGDAVSSGSDTKMILVRLERALR